MRYSQQFPKTIREAPKDAATANHKLLVRAGFIDQLMAGSWTLLPLGWRVLTRVNAIVREEMNAIGAQEMLMPLLHPKEIWNETGRWNTASEVMYQLKDTREKEFALSFTHEEIVMDLLRKHIKSYKDLPAAVYHFSTKFRNEARPTGGILRGREFIMKDLYSAHASEEDLMAFYEKVKGAYLRAFERIGFTIRVTEASGGVFTDKHTHEFQVVTDAGEDTIFYCDTCEFGQNKEVQTVQAGDRCPQCGKGTVMSGRSIEVGNIFPLGTMYATKMEAYFTDYDGSRKVLWFGSYGIGVSRVIGSLVEVFHDEKGITWPKSVAPYDVHLVEIKKDAEQVYLKLKDAGIEVLWDETERGAGEKFADADLIGIPVRLVVSEKTGDKIEWKERTRDTVELLTLEEVINRLK